MKKIGKLLIWYPDRSVLPAELFRCGTCNQKVITRPGTEPMEATKRIAGAQPEHRHMVVRRDLFLKLSTAGLCRCLEQAGDDPSCPVHGRSKDQAKS